MSVNRPREAIPALFTRISICPHCCRSAPITDSISEYEAASARKVRQEPCMAKISFFRRSRPSSSVRAVAATW